MDRELYLKHGTSITINISNDDVKYLRFGLATYDYNLEKDIPITVTNIQLEKSSRRTLYEPYKEPQTFNIYLDEPLRKAGDVGDYIDLKTGQVVRKVKETIIDGNSNWNIYSFYSEAGNLIYYGFSVSILDNTYSRIDGLSNMSKYIGHYYDKSYTNSMWLGVNNAYIYFIFNDYYDDTLEDKRIKQI